MIIGSESEPAEFKLSAGEKRQSAEAVAAILNKHTRGPSILESMTTAMSKGRRYPTAPNATSREP